MSISVKAEGLDEVVASLGRFTVTKAFTQFLDGAGPRIARGLRDAAPYRSVEGTNTPEHRHLRDSIRYERHTVFGLAQAIFTSDVPQARFVIEGTRAHPIDPKPSNPRQMLAWLRDGTWSRARHVDHPGTDANPFPTHYVQFHRSELQSEFARAVSRTFHDMLGGL